MPDREKVSKGKEHLDAIMEIATHLSYPDYGIVQEHCLAILALLKEQEKAKVVFGRCKDGSFATECGHCGTYLDKPYSICPKCNKELDWNSNQD